MKIQPPAKPEYRFETHVSPPYPQVFASRKRFFYFEEDGDIHILDGEPISVDELKLIVPALIDTKTGFIWCIFKGRGFEVSVGWNRNKNIPKDLAELYYDTDRCEIFFYMSCSEKQHRHYVGPSRNDKKGK